VVSSGRVGYVRAWNGGHGWQRGARLVRARLGQSVLVRLGLVGYGGARRLWYVAVGRGEAG